LFFGTYVMAEKGNFVAGHKIVIDAGHGGSDPGSTECDGLYEKDANLDIAERLKTKLEANDAVVYMTREDDVYKTNADRYDYANSTDGEVLVSIHLNGSTKHDVNGSMSLYTKPWKDKDFTATVHNDIVDMLGVGNLGITNFMSGVTLKFNGPAAMLEPVYISNTDECRDLTDGSGERQDQIADSIYEGLNNWFDGNIVEVFQGSG
ncbi:N-acetylmuramoyl-L-alanine amidase, partial [Patescibacteria group bacterium]